MRKNEVKDFDTLDEYYTKVRKFKFADDVIIESLNDIYNNLFTLNREGFVQKPTYYVKGSLQCNSGRYRSIDDFIKVSKKYFPEKTIKELFTFLREKEEKFKEEDKIQTLRYCSTIRKYNFSGTVPIAYGARMTIMDYKLRDLNTGLKASTVSDLLT